MKQWKLRNTPTAKEKAKTKEKRDNRKLPGTYGPARKRQIWKNYQDAMTPPEGWKPRTWINGVEVHE